MRRFLVGSNWRDPWEEDGEVGRQLVFREMSIYSVERNDNTVVFNFDFPEMGSFSFVQKLYTVGDSEKPSYTGREFNILPMEGKSAGIPLIFFNSVWWDDEYDIYRSCMENRINPDLSNDAIRNVTHYYIIGIEASEI